MTFNCDKFFRARYRSYTRIVCMHLQYEVVNTVFSSAVYSARAYSIIQIPRQAVFLSCILWDLLVQSVEARYA